MDDTALCREAVADMPDIANRHRGAIKHAEQTRIGRTRRSRSTIVARKRCTVLGVVRSGRKSGVVVSSRTVASDPLVSSKSNRAVRSQRTEIYKVYCPLLDILGGVNPNAVAGREIVCRIFSFQINDQRIDVTLLRRADRTARCNDSTGPGRCRWVITNSTVNRGTVLKLAWSKSGDALRIADRAKQKPNYTGEIKPHQWNCPTQVTDRLAPVVTFHAPLVLTAPTGSVNGTKLERLDEPPGKPIIVVELSRMVTTPGDVEVGITTQYDR